jgi:hypothetical protein
VKLWRLLYWAAALVVLGPFLLPVLAPALLAHHLNRRDSRRRTPEEQRHDQLRKAANE